MLKHKNHANLHVVRKCVFAKANGCHLPRCLLHLYCIQDAKNTSCSPKVFSAETSHNRKGLGALGLIPHKCIRHQYVINHSSLGQIKPEFFQADFLSVVSYFLTQKVTFMQTELIFDIKQTEISSIKISYCKCNVYRLFFLSSGKTSFVTTCKDSPKVQVAENAESDNKNRVFRQQK